MQANRQWLEHWCAANTTGTFFDAHLADYLRFYLLSAFGGCYTDADVVFTSSLPRHGPLAALAAAEAAAPAAGDAATKVAVAAWHLFPDKRQFISPG